MLFKKHNLYVSVRCLTAFFAIFAAAVCFSVPVFASTNIFLFEDDTNSVSAEMVLKRDDLFNKTSDTSLGFSSSTFWLKIYLTNNSNETAEQLIVFDSLHLPSITEISVTDKGTKSIRKNGYLIPQNERPLRNRFIAFPHTLKPLSHKTILIKIESDYKIDLGYQILDADSFVQRSERNIIFSSLLIGALFFLFTFQTLQAVVSREPIYWLYSIFIAGALSLTVITTRLYETTGVHLDFVELEARCGQLIYITSIVFLVLFFKLQRSKVILYLSLIGLALILLHTPFTGAEIMQLYSQYTGIPILAIMGSIISIGLRREFKSTNIVVAIGWASYIFLSIPFILNLYGFLGPQFEYFLTYGNILEGILFSFALIERARQSELKAKLVDAMRQNQIVIEQQAEELKQRTIDLKRRSEISQKQALEIAETNVKLLQQATTDPLTGLSNRIALTRLTNLDNSHKRPRRLGIYLIDVDYFKSVNDTYSHEVGDNLLVAIANTLREVTSKGDIVARLGGEEFIILTPWINHKQAEDFADLVRRELSNTFATSKLGTVSRTVSIGVAELHRHEALGDKMNLADLALSEAKETGRNKVIIASENFVKEMEARGAFITELEVEQALVAGEFCYYAQPIYNTELELVEGFEALIRWIKPDGRIISPSIFISKFQNVFFKPEYLAIRQAMRKNLIDNLSAFPSSYVSWNFEIEQFSNDEYVEAVRTTAAELLSGTTHTFVIEISEKAISDRFILGSVVPNIKKLRDAGFLIALDDFGTEQSNIHRLTQIPLDILKIDKCLVDGMITDPKKRATVRAISLLARSLDIKCIAEGVETLHQSKLLSATRVFAQQGYYHAHPLHVDDLSGLKCSDIS